MAIITYRIEIIRLFSKKPVGSSKQVLRASPVDFAEKWLETLVDIFTPATTFT